MKKYHVCDANKCYQEVFSEIYKIDSLISMVKKMCEEREFKSEYYNLSKSKAEKLSIERNDYINVLTIVSDRISNVIRLNLQMETEMSLKQNTNY